MREWIRHNGRWAIVLATPAFLILPTVTFILGQLVQWVVALVAIAGHLIVLPVVALVAALVGLVVINIAKAIFK